MAFEAISRREAGELCKEQWFREELLSLRSEKVQIWNGKEALTARAADPAEVCEFQRAQAVARNEESDEILLAYLVSLDEVG